MFGRKPKYPARIDARQIVQPDDGLSSTHVIPHETDINVSRVDEKYVPYTDEEGLPHLRERRAEVMQPPNVRHPGGTVTWTIESPTVEGYYWWRRRGSRAAVPDGQCRVENRPILGLCIREERGTNFRNVDSFAREWAGPLADAVEP